MTEENLKGCDIPEQLNFSDWAVCMYAWRLVQICFSREEMARIQLVVLFFKKAQCYIDAVIGYMATSYIQMFIHNIYTHAHIYIHSYIFIVNYLLLPTRLHCHDIHRSVHAELFDCCVVYWHNYK